MKNWRPRLAKTAHKSSVHTLIAAMITAIVYILQFVCYTFTHDKKNQAKSKETDVPQNNYAGLFREPSVKSTLADSQEISHRGDTRFKESEFAGGRAFYSHQNSRRDLVSNRIHRDERGRHACRVHFNDDAQYTVCASIIRSCDGNDPRGISSQHHVYGRGVAK